MASAAVGWLLLGRGIRGFSHLRRHPREIFLLPLVALVVIVIALPVKTYAFLTMNKQGWLTRTEDLTGGEGQDHASVTHRQRSVLLPRQRETADSERAGGTR